MFIPITEHTRYPNPEYRNLDTKFYSTNGTLLVTGYIRFVLRERGAYINFSQVNVCMENLHFFPDPKWRIHSDVKVYEQRRTVGYADNKVGKFYIAPGDATVNHSRKHEESKKDADVRISHRHLC